MKPPTFAASPTTLAFVAVVGDTATTPPQVASLTYAPGPVAASWQAKVKGTASWLQMSPASGTTPSALSISANPSGLAQGIYTGTVQVTSQNALGSPQLIAVTLAIAQAPVLTALPGQLTFAGVTGGTQLPAQTVNIVYPGATVNWQASGSQPWLSIAPSSGATPSAFSVSVSGAGLPPGTYTDTVTVTAPGAAGSPVAIPVVMTVEPPPGETCAGNAWYCEPFDELTSGDLNGQGGWHVVNATDGTAQVDLDPRGVGKVGIFDAPSGNVEKDQVNFGKKHLADGTEIGLQVMETGASPHGKHISKIEFFTDSGYFGKSGRTFGALRIGSGLDLQYGANIDQSLVDSMESGRFYDVLMQYSHGYLFAFVDGALKFSISSGLTADKPLKAFATTSWDLSPGLVNFDVLQARPATPQPLLLAAPASLAINATPGAQASQAFAVSEVNMPADAAWQATVDQPWLSVDPASGTGNGTVVVTATPGTLAVGTYFGNVTLTAVGALNSPLVVPVTLEVATAQLVVSPLSIQLGARTESQATQLLTIDETPEAGGPTWQVSTDQPWLTLDQASGVGPVTVTVIADATGLPVGSYAGNVIVMASDASGSPVTVPVTFLVTGFNVDPPSATLLYPEGGVCPGSGPPIAALRPSDSSKTAALAKSTRPSHPLAQGLSAAFEPNRGQLGKDVLFLAHGRRQDLLLGQSSVSVASHTGQAKPVTLSFKGADNAKAEALDPLPGRVNHIKGSDPSRWVVGVPLYARALYRQIYPGIDLLFHGDDGRLEHDWIVSPGSDPGRIETEIANASSLSLDAAGDLVIEAVGGQVRMKRPKVYQERNGERRPVEASYVIHGSDQVRFALAAYDHSSPLVIDPVLVYSSYLGGSNGDSGDRIAVDGAGNIYVGGTTFSADFPVTGGVVDPAHSADWDVFVAKLDPTGSSLLFATYYGGTGSDRLGGLAVASSGNVVIGGTTDSQDLPVASPGGSAVADAYRGGNTDGFIATLAPDGSHLLAATYLGGSADDHVTGLALGGDDSVFLTGSTNSFDFPTGSLDTSATPIQTVLNGDPSAMCFFFDPFFQFTQCDDAFVTKLGPDGVLVYSTYLGGHSHEQAQGIAVGPDGSAYITGTTSSPDLPVINPLVDYGADFGCCDVPFLASLNPKGSALNYSTWLGSVIQGQYAVARGIAVDSAGAAYVVGSTYFDFPLGVPNGYQQSPHQDDLEGFALKVAPGGGSVVYGTFLGGSGDDSPNAVAVDPAGNAHIVGVTSSVDFPSTNCFRGYGGGQDAFMATLSPDGTQLVQGTFFGGTGNDQASDVAIHAGRLYVTGSTDSPDLPLASPFQSQLQQSDAFVATVDLATTAASTGTILLAQPSLSASESGGSASILVSRVCGSNGAVSVGYHTSAETAVPGVNYTDGAGTVTFGDGDASPKVISVPILDDQSLVCGLTFDVSLDPPTVNPPGSSLGLPTSTVTIIDDTGVTKVRARLSVANPDGPTTWTVTSDSDWLTVDIGSGTTPSTVSAIADGSPLSDGTYTGRLTFTLPASGAQFVVPITFVVGNTGGG